jgi:hypothetical protein
MRFIIIAIALLFGIFLTYAVMYPRQAIELLAEGVIEGLFELIFWVIGSIFECF